MSTQRAGRKDPSVQTSMRRRRFLALSGSALVGGCTAPTARGLNRESTPAAENRGPEWSVKRFDAANTAYNPDAFGAGESARSVWRSSVGNITATPVVGGGSLYTGGGRNVYAIDLENGSKRWEIETDVITGTHSPVATSDAVCVAGQQDGEGRLLAISPADGTIEWTRDFSKITSPTVNADTLYISESEESRGRLYAIDIATGEFRWDFSVTEPGYSEISDVPAVRDGIVYCTAGYRLDRPDSDKRGRLYALDAEKGTKLWSMKIGHPAVTAPSVTEDTVYFGDTGGRVHAVSVEKGVEEWTYEVDGEVQTPPAIANGKVYVRDTAGAIIALDGNRGRVKWITAVDSSDIAPTIGGDTIYVGGNELTALDRENGSVRWTYNVSAYSSSHYAPAISRSNVFYGVCIKQNPGEEYENYIYAIN